MKVFQILASHDYVWGEIEASSAEEAVEAFAQERGIEPAGLVAREVKLAEPSPKERP